MKLNFWQWIGLIVFLIALGFVIWKQAASQPTTQQPAVPAPAIVTP
jgi:hypothetical protein